MLQLYDNSEKIITRAKSTVYKVLAVTALSTNTVPQPAVAGLKGKVYLRKSSILLTDLLVYQARQNERNTAPVIFP
jgi:hypothetical protein